MGIVSTIVFVLRALLGDRAATAAENLAVPASNWPFSGCR
jgi:hypothetical protein